jgi:exodeoxyribonuclease VII large subunit
MVAFSDRAAREAWTVAALLRAVSDALSARFGACTVRGEISGFTRAASGHCYFAVKDLSGEAVVLRCAMFRRAASLLDFAAADGQEVELRGRVAVYEPRGELQFVVESMRRCGAGAMYEQFMRLKAKLEAEGLFDAARKRELPRFVERVGVVTSLAAAALRDVLTALARRAPHVQVVVYPTPVQGADAPLSIQRALALANERREVDLLLLVRGGGSLEDLWAFNDEQVVRAVAASALPVVCGVGHETDVTLSDFAADLRAPTPTAAAELAVVAADDWQQALAVLAARLVRAGRHRLDRQAQTVDRLGAALARPAERLLRLRQGLQALEQRRTRALQGAIQFERLRQRALSQRLGTAAAGVCGRQALRLHGAEARLHANDPLRILSRGYAWVADGQGRALVSAQQVHEGQRLVARWADGRADTVVERVVVAPERSDGA